MGMIALERFGMTTVSITLDAVTRQLEATATGFAAWLVRSSIHYDWYTIHVTIGDKMCELLRGRLGTLDELKLAMELAYERVH